MLILIKTTSMKRLLPFLFILILFSCSKDESQSSAVELNVAGKFLAPNNLDPVANAKAQAWKDGNLVDESLTDSQGNYTLSIPEGVYTLKLLKGLFTTEKNIEITEETTLENFKIETIPKIGVVKGDYDNIESVLYSMGLFDPDTLLPVFDIIGWTEARVANVKHINHGHNSNAERTNNPLLDVNVDFGFSDLLEDPVQLAGYDVIFINCGIIANEVDGGQNLLDYVNNGGFLYATDWASSTLETITNNDTDYISFYTPRKSGTSLSTMVSIADPSLSEWLLINFGISTDDTVEIDEFLISWQVVDSFDPLTTISWLNGPVEYRDADTNIIAETKDLAFTFQLGNGAVFYSSFHTENNELDFTTTDRIMEYMVFEMTDLNE